jgi:hypothetical protein
LREESPDQSKNVDRKKKVEQNGDGPSRNATRRSAGKRGGRPEMVNPSGLTITLMIIVCLCAAPAHGDTIYTCAGRNGAEVLQNRPCETDSEVSVQKDLHAATAADGPSNDGAVPGRQAAQNAASDASAAATDAAAAASDELANLPSEPALGMTQKQVRAILGAPTAITQEEASEGIEMTWIYSDSRVLQFDAAGRLSKK